MADVNKLWTQMQEKLTPDELEDIYNRLDEYYNFEAYVENNINLIHSMCEHKLVPPYRDIKQVIFNPPATIILWNDNTKSVVKCQDGEPYDAEKGFALAYLKKLLGNDNTFNKEIHKWVK